MQGIIPSTPAEVLNLPPAFKTKMNRAFTLAKIFRFWDRPYKKAATAFEEMDVKDKFYWVYKCTNPITRVEKGQRAADLVSPNKRIVDLPKGFEKQASITMGAAGDLFQTEVLANSKDIFFENVTDLLFDQTISYANFESPITEQELKQEGLSDQEIPIECCTPTQFDILKGHKGKNFNIINTANNHMFDLGIEGVRATQKILKETGILDVGTNGTPAEYGQGKIITKDGIKIGVVSATFSLNGRQMPADENYRINVSKLTSKFSKPELDILKLQIDHCKAQGCDFIIASLHWGYEFEFFPRQQQVDTAHALVEYGVDAILGHHPHVIQPVEYYRTKRDNNRVAVIAYSLGSLAWNLPLRI